MFAHAGQAPDVRAAGVASWSAEVALHTSFTLFDSALSRVGSMGQRCTAVDRVLTPWIRVRCLEGCPTPEPRATIHQKPPPS